MKTPLTLVKSKADQVASTRSCGECTACCVLPRICDEPSFPQGKQGYTPCDKLCASGCSIYEDRPALCREYSCLWRVGVIDGDERRRPDNLGLMFVPDMLDGKITIEVWELWEGAATENPGKWVMEAIRKVQPVSIRFYGVPASIYYSDPRHLTLGRELSVWARTDPKRLAAWCEYNMVQGNLDHPNLPGALRDLDALKSGEAVAPYYQPK